MQDERHARIPFLEAVLADPPQVHPHAPEGVWHTDDQCYRFLADHLPSMARTVETGCGISTVLFTAWSADHVCVVPSAEQAELLERHCRDRQLDTSRLRFDLRTSDVALPTMVDDGPIDLAFVDGSHGFPQALLDWYYSGQRLVAGGFAILDDVWLRQVSAGLVEFLDADPRWERVAGTWKWSAYRKLTDHSLCEEWTEQRFVRQASPSLLHKVVRTLPPRARVAGRKIQRRLTGRAG